MDSVDVEALNNAARVLSQEIPRFVPFLNQGQQGQQMLEKLEELLEILNRASGKTIGCRCEEALEQHQEALRRHENRLRYLEAHLALNPIDEPMVLEALAPSSSRDLADSSAKVETETPENHVSNDQPVDSSSRPAGDSSSEKRSSIGGFSQFGDDEATLIRAAEEQYVSTQTRPTSPMNAVAETGLVRSSSMSSVKTDIDPGPSANSSSATIRPGVSGLRAQPPMQPGIGNPREAAPSPLARPRESTTSAGQEVNMEDSATNADSGPYELANDLPGPSNRTRPAVENWPSLSAVHTALIVCVDRLHSGAPVHFIDLMEAMQLERWGGNWTGDDIIPAILFLESNGVLKVDNYQRYYVAR